LFVLSELIAANISHFPNAVAHETKGNPIMGDKSPKSIHKQSSQKLTKSAHSDQVKQETISAKQFVNKKK